MSADLSRGLCHARAGEKVVRLEGRLGERGNEISRLSKTWCVCVVCVSVFGDSIPSEARSLVLFYYMHTSCYLLCRASCMHSLVPSPFTVYTSRFWLLAVCKIL